MPHRSVAIDLGGGAVACRLLPAPSFEGSWVMSAQHEQSMPGPKKASRREDCAAEARAAPACSARPVRLAAPAGRASRVGVARDAAAAAARGATGPFIVACSCRPAKTAQRCTARSRPGSTKHGARVTHARAMAQSAPRLRRSVRASSRRWSATACSASSMPTSTAQPDASAAPTATCSRRSPTRRDRARPREAAGEALARELAERERRARAAQRPSWPSSAASSRG